MRVILLILWCLPVTLYAQNLVANGSFEDENICSEYIKNCSPEAWIISSLQSNFYFDDRANAYDGTHFVGLVAGANGRYGSRNFITTQLLCGMRKGASYKIECYVRKGIEQLDSVGVVFTADNLLYRKWGLKEVQPALWIKEGLSTTSNESWQKYTGIYQANGSESFLDIALFKQQRPERMRSLVNPDFYFYIDKISVTPLDPNERLCASANDTKADLYAFNDRHEALERHIYPLQRKDPVIVKLRKTVVQKVDTLIIPDVLFATDKYNLSKKATQLLDSFIHSHEQVILDSIAVAGHTDSTGSISHNEQLSQNRAASVASYLGEQMTVPIRPKGYASEKPVADNRTAAGRQKNRRVEIYLYIRD